MDEHVLRQHAGECEFRVRGLIADGPLPQIDPCRADAGAVIFQRSERVCFAESPASRPCSPSRQNEESVSAGTTAGGRLACLPIISHWALSV